MDTNSIDIIGKIVDGGIDLVIIVPDVLEDSEELQSQLLDKIENYLNYIKGAEFKKDFPGIGSDNIFIKLKLRVEPSERLLKWLDEIKRWVESSGVKLLV